MRFELTTLTLARLCSTPELRPHSVSVRILYKSPRAAARGKNNRSTEDREIRHDGEPLRWRWRLPAVSPIPGASSKETAMKGIIAWAIGLPIPIIILLYLFDVF
jgi:hypothetical protein